MSDSWSRLLEYRTRARNWVGRHVGIADTRLRVARLLDAAFDYGWDEVEADFEVLGHRADFLLLLSGTPWGIVIVQPMGSGFCPTPPPEAFVMADGAGVAWCWLTDGLTLQLYHVSATLALTRVIQCDLLDDDERDLQSAWHLMCRDGVTSGRLDRFRQERERPDHDAVRRALTAPAVLLALQETLARDFVRPGDSDELALLVARLCAPPPVTVSARQITAPTPPTMPPEAVVTATASPLDAPAVGQPDDGGVAFLADDDDDADDAALGMAEGADDPEPADAPVATVDDSPDELAWRLPTGEVAEPEEITVTDLAPTADEVSPADTEAPTKRRRRGGWRLVDDADSGGADVAAVTALAIPDPADAEPDPSAGNGLGSAPLDGTDDLGSGQAATLPDGDGSHQLPPVGGDRTAGRFDQDQLIAAGAPAPTETILTTLERQRQTHHRLRQNIQDLRENRERLQDALAELQGDYPERFERKAANQIANSRRQAAQSAKPASWTLLGHLQSLGNGYWEWSAADDAGPGVRLN